MKTLKSTLLVGRIGAAAAVLLLAACTGSQPAGGPAGSGGDAGTAPASGAIKVDKLVFATAPPATENNIERMLGQFDAVALKPIYEFLVGHGPDTDKLVPQLATDWKLEPDGKGYRFQLKKGVQFHKGLGEFTAKDVVFTWEEETKADALQAEAPYWRSTVKRIDIINDYEVVFQIEPDSNFLHGLSEAESGMEVRSKADYDKRGDPTPQTEPLAGTAPYQFVSRELQQYIRFQKTPFQHYRVTPDFPEFEFRYIKEGSTRLASLLAGESHMATLGRDLQDRAGKEGMKVVRGRVPGARIFLNPTAAFVADVDKLEGWLYPDSPLMDVRVRKALQKAVNVEELSKVFFGGTGQTMYNPMINEVRQGWNPDWQKNYKDEYGYDADAARKLLSDAGYTAARPLETSLHVVELGNYPGMPDMIEAIGNYWRTVGVKVTLLQIDPAQRAQQNRQLRFSNDWQIDQTSTAQYTGVFSRFISQKRVPPRGGKHPDLDRLFFQVRQELDEKKQDAWWRQIGDWMYKDHTVLNLFWVPVDVTVNPKVVSDYVWPGISGGNWTHVWYIKAAAK
ncbi:MAG: ABC transporter substrate-binding protein [Dehalococcoidia bacterium]|nr:ABC transporter substrate-binding protein [Dehalococcoidia bacterium]